MALVGGCEMHLLVTRPQPQADDWVRRLAGLGLHASALPLLAIEDAPDPAAVRAAWGQLPTQRLAMFVSPSAVDRFFACAPAGWQWPSRTVAGGTGPGTARALAAAGVPPGCIICPAADSPRLDSEALWALLRHRLPWRGEHALIVRGEGGRDWLADTLRAEGAQVAFVTAYRRAPPRLDAQTAGLLEQALAQPAGHLWLLSSSEAVQQLPRLLAGRSLAASQALATHPRIAATAREVGFGRVDEVGASVESVAHAARARSSGPTAG